MSESPPKSSSPISQTNRHLCLAFHKVSSGLSFGVTNYSPHRFRKLLEYLGNSGFGFSGQAPAKERQVLITFDDGYMHLSDLLPELIERYSFQPLVFMPTYFIGKSNSWDYSHLFRKVEHLDRSAIRKLSEAGVRFGSHGHRHLDLRFENNKGILEELTISKTILEDITGKEVSDISYPFGRYNMNVLEMVTQCGYQNGFTMKFPTIDDTSLIQGRAAVYSFDSYRTVLRKLGGGPLYRLEQFKSTCCNQLSFGTVILNRIFPRPHD